MDTTSRIACHVVDIGEARIDPQAAIAAVTDDAFGGIAVFIGRVRSSSHGHECVAVHYDMFDPLALTVFQRSVAKALAQYGPKAKGYVAHAKGQLAVGEIAVVVAFGTPHRDEAFRGCRDIIEAVKHEAPIWKQEHFVDGKSEWSEGCSLCGKEGDDGKVAAADAAGPSPAQAMHGHFRARY